MPIVRPNPFGPEPESPRHPRRDRLIAAVLLVLLVIARLADVTPVALLRLWSFDLASLLRPPAAEPPAVAVVDIDDASLLVTGQWPWPRDVLAELIGALADAGATVVVLDMLLAEPDRLPPADPGKGTVPGGSDAVLASAMSKVPVVAGAALSSFALPARDDDPAVGRFAVRGTLAAERIVGALSVVRPLPALEAASRGFGVVNLYPHVDAAVRSVPGVVAVEGALLPGIALEAVRVARGASGFVIDAPGMDGPDGVWVGGRFIPTDTAGRIRVDARNTSRIPVVSAHRLLSGDADLATFTGRVVIVGASAAGLGSQVRTVVDGGLSHAHFQALAIDTMLGGRVVSRPAFLKSAEIAAAVLIGAVLVVAGPWLALSALGRAAFLLVISLPATAAAVTASTGALIDITLVLIVGLAILGQLAWTRIYEESGVRRRQAALLARQDAYMRQVVDASFDAIVTVDRDARIITANRGATRLFGVSAEALVGAGIADFLEGSLAESLRLAPEQALLDAAERHRVILASIDRPGSLAVPAELTVAETATTDRAFVIVLRNISARLQAEAAARRAADRLRDGIARITDGFALFGPDRRLIICNERFVAMLGEAGAAAQDHDRFEVIMERYAETSCAPRDAVGRADDWLAARMAAFRQAIEPRIQETMDGRWFRVDERPTAEGGLVGVYTDITELKWREMEMTDAMLRAEAASSAKSEFLANMSHELRTPLNAVIGFADLMKRELLGPLGNDHYRSYVGDIIDSGSKLLSMIEAILEFSRSEHSALGEPEAPCDLNEIMHAVVRDLHPAALEREVAVTAVPGNSVLPVAIGGAVLYQILQNLLSNAIKFSGRGGPVSVRIFVAPDGRPAVEVKDRGIGVPPELIDKVTQPFWQRQGPLVRSHGGVGLGLAIVKSHIESIEGELLFDSRLDEGTTVTVLFPASRTVREV